MLYKAYVSASLV